ncbi:COQ9-domain-containing protein [Delphinella strobiligena]|nr:COQ9-domain-containing protein [Delphinella strobiligena]
MRALLLQCPASIRPTLASPIRAYHSYETPPKPTYPPAETAILSAAMRHVPSHGFTQATLRQGARDAGYLDASSNLFRRGEFELVMWHLRSQRMGLGGRIQFPERDGKVGVARKVRGLVLERLRGNVDAGVLPRLQEALALMSLAGNIPPSLRELWLLSDEVWFLAGDQDVDTSWYTKRASLSSIYAATEVYQTTDRSTDFRDTAEFLDRRLNESRILGSSWKNVTEWAQFQGMAGVNLARSWGMRI